MAESERLHDRNERWYREYIKGTTLRAIAEREGMHPSTVHAAIKQVRDSTPEDSRDQVIKDAIEAYHLIQAEAFRIAEMLPAPVVVGKDGNILTDPDTGAIVRDYSGRLRAYETAMKTIEAQRKVLGLDAAVRVEQTITDQAAAEKAAEEARKRLEGAENGGE